MGGHPREAQIKSVIFKARIDFVTVFPKDNLLWVCWCFEIDSDNRREICKIGTISEYPGWTVAAVTVD